MPTHYKLTYFAVPGQAEHIRLLFALAQQPYDEVNFPMTIQHGKRVREEWMAVKPNRKLYPFAQVPTLTVTDDSGSFVLAQRHAIGRYLARQFNLAGSNAREAALIDAADEHIRITKDAMGATGIFREVVTAETEQTFIKWLNSTESLQMLEVYAVLHGGQHGIVGNSTTLADVMLYCFYDSIITLHSGRWKSAMDGRLKQVAPTIKQIIDDFVIKPIIVQYLKHRDERIAARTFSFTAPVVS